MKAKLIDPEGNVRREWQTNDKRIAKTADRNFPPGWRVEVNE